MQTARTIVDFHEVEATLLPALSVRAQFSKEFPPAFNDEKAIELVDQIEYDFPIKDAALGLEGTIVIVAREKQFDDKIRAYVMNIRDRRLLTSVPGLTPPLSCRQWIASLV